MNKGAKIGLLASITAISAGLVWYFTASKKQKHAPEQKQGGRIKKSYGDEDSYLSIDTEKIKKVLGPGGKDLTKSAKQNANTGGTKKDISGIAQGTGVQEKQLYSNMAKVSGDMVKKHLPATMPTPPVKKPSTYQKFYSWLTKEFKRTQITITNTSPEAKKVTLWGGNRGVTLSPPAPVDVEDHKVIAGVVADSPMGRGIHPQGIAYNPANNLTYIANQLSNNVTVIDAAGQVVWIVQLQPSGFPGYNSPVAIAVNTNTDSPRYGYVYVAGSVANTISIIDMGFNVVKEVAAGVRPVALAFNPVDQQLYVANLVNNSLTVMDTETDTLTTTLPVGRSPRAVAINPDNGDIYITNAKDNTVSIYDTGHVLVDTIGNVGIAPVAVTYHPVNNEMYIVSAGTNNVIPVDAATYAALPEIEAGSKPYGIAFNTNNNYLYVTNAGDETITVIAPDKSVRATISVGNVNIGFAINQAENMLFATDTAANTVNVIGYAGQSSSIAVDGDYHETNNDITANPIILKHAKFIISGNPDAAKILTVKYQAPTGTVQNNNIALTNYMSPQNYLKVIEAFDIDGNVIDGKTRWEFMVAGGQTVSLLLYYKQLDIASFMPDRARVVADNGMSKGVPDSWKAAKKATKQNKK